VVVRKDDHKRAPSQDHDAEQSESRKIGDRSKLQREHMRRPKNLLLVNAETGSCRMLREPLRKRWHREVLCELGEVSTEGAVREPKGDRQVSIVSTPGS